MYLFSPSVICPPTLSCPPPPAPSAPAVPSPQIHPQLSLIPSDSPLDHETCTLGRCPRFPLLGQKQPLLGHPLESPPCHSAGSDHPAWGKPRGHKGPHPQLPSGAPAPHPTRSQPSLHTQGLTSMQTLSKRQPYTKPWGQEMTKTQPSLHGTPGLVGENDGEQLSELSYVHLGRNLKNCAGAGWGSGPGRLHWGSDRAGIRG